MRAIVSDWYTDIQLSPEEFKEHCKPGAGAITCIWVLVGKDGFECCYYHRPHVLVDRWERGETHAKRDGCEKVKSFQPAGELRIEDF